MELLSDCPDCGKQLKNAKRSCTCGWKIVEINQPEKKDHTCGFLLPKGECKNIGTIAYGRSQRWYCGSHWYEAMFSSYKINER